MRRTAVYIILPIILLYLTIEFSFLIACLDKFAHGGYVTLLIAIVLIVIMAIWFKAKQIGKSYTKFVKIDSYKKVLAELSVDLSIPKYATHLIYMTNAGRVDEIEEKVMYSILQKRPKRADIYWFIHVNVLSEPYNKEYKVTEIVKDDLYRIDFNLGFREPTKINLMFKEVIKDMVQKGEVDITSRYESLNKNNIFEMTNGFCIFSLVLKSVFPFASDISILGIKSDVFAVSAPVDLTVIVTFSPFCP